MHGGVYRGAGGGCGKVKKKVLVFNGYYLPAKKYGGPTTSLVNIVENCSDDFDFYIIAANHEMGETKPFDNITEGWNQVGKAKVLYAKPGTYKNHPAVIENTLMELKPDLVWIVGILVPNTKWPLARLCRKHHIAYIVSPRGEVCDNTFHMKYAKKKATATVAWLTGAYRNATFHATSEEERQGLIKYYHAPADRIFFAPNISSHLKAAERQIEKKAGALNMVFIARIQEKKNLLEAIQAANLVKGDVNFDIYGPMESKDYWAQCEQEIAKSPANVHIQYCGALSPNQVTDTFMGYHAFAFPTVSENYGHVIVEALCCSCPVLLTRGTTPWDDLDGQAGFTSELHNVPALAENMQRVADMDQAAYDQFMASSAAYYNRRIEADNAVALHIELMNTAIAQKG